jgi:ABC-type nitrate/sulfonate/bicarbonate transport system substrate-binding protein
MGKTSRAGGRRRMLIPSALLTAGALALAACGSSSSGSKTNSTPSSGAPSGSKVAATSSGPNTPKPQPLASKTKLTIGYTAPIEVFGEPELALLNGEFAKENIDATVKQVVSSTVPQLLAQNNIQIALSGIGAGTLNAIHQGIKLKAIGNPETLQASDPSGLYIQKKFLDSSGMLKKPLPKNFTLTLGDQGLGAVSIYWTEKYLEANGLSISDTTNVNLAQNLIGKALQNGSVDAGFANNPYAGSLVKDPSLMKVAPAGGAAWYITTQSYLDQHADVAQAAMRALVRTARTYLASGYRDNANVMGQLSKWLGVDQATIKLSPAPVFLPNMDLSLLEPIAQGVQQSWIKVGNVLNYSDPTPFSTLSDPTVLEAVVGKPAPYTPS